MKGVPIDLSLVDFEDKTFYTGNIGNLDYLKDSIKELGVLNSPILREKGDVYQVITGWKRLLSCRDLDHAQVLCRVYGTELADHTALRVIYLDNKDRLSDLELAEIILLHKTLCCLDDNELMQHVLPAYELPSSRKYLDKYLALSTLEEEIKKAFFEEKITIEQCQMLSELTPDNRLPILRKVLLKYKLNNNESRQVMQHISEIASIKLKSVLGVINDVESNIKDGKIDKNSLRDELKRMRYPDLTHVEEKVRNSIKDLELPQGVNLVINQFFEANDIEFRIKAKTSEELEEICNNISVLCEKGDIERLLIVLKNGI